MKGMRYQLLGLSIIICCFLIGCGEDQPAYQNTGTVKGQVSFYYQEDVNPDLASLGHLLNGELAKVQLRGASNMSASIDSMGYYELQGVPIGTYAMEFSVEGFYENKISPVKVYGGDIPVTLNTSMFKILRDSIAFDSLKIVYDNTIGAVSVNPMILRITGKKNHEYYEHVLIYGEDSTLSLKNYDHLEMLAIANNDIWLQSSLDSTWFRDINQVYARIYVFIGNRLLNSYQDPETGAMQYSNVDPRGSEVVKLKYENLR